MAWVTLNDCLSTVAISKGGTGLTSAPMLATNLASTSATSIFQSAPRPGVVGILPIANGGTGATTAEEARANLGAASQDLVDQIVFQGFGASDAPSCVEAMGNFSMGIFRASRWGNICFFICQLKAKSNISSQLSTGAYQSILKLKGVLAPINNAYGVVGGRQGVGNINTDGYGQSNPYATVDFSFTTAVASGTYAYISGCYLLAEQWNSIS